MKKFVFLNREKKGFVIIVLDKSGLLLLRFSQCDLEFKTTQFLGRKYFYVGWLQRKYLCCDDFDDNKIVDLTKKEILNVKNDF